MTGLPFAKGHGTGNDFVIVPDPDNQHDLSAAQVAALCDRRRGIGGDGLLRVVRTPDGEWFMDYRNADGSLAEMCGNGVRVYARYLVETGLSAGPRVPILTRAGRVVAEVGDDEIAVEMPMPEVHGKSAVRVCGVEHVGTVATCGNPHLVCRVDDAAALDQLDLSGTPEFDTTVFPAGANVEFAAPVAEQRVRMRVIERGVGETASCGSGACAVAAVTLAGSDGTVQVDVPGGSLTVTLTGTQCVLAGPAVIVASGTLTNGLLGQLSPA